MALPNTTGNLTLDYTAKSIPSKTWRIDLENGYVESNTIDDTEAVQQAAVLALLTERGACSIYSENYGMERLLGVDKDIQEIEVENNIKEALSVDERIDRLDNFNFTYPERGKMAVTFDIITVQGAKVQGETEINGVL